VIYSYLRTLGIAVIATLAHWANLWLGRVFSGWMRFGLRSTQLTFSVGFSLLASMAVAALLPVLISAQIGGFRPADGLLFLAKWF
jgi:hypothetical protein